MDIQRLIIGSIIFMVIDRFVKILSQSILQKNSSPEISLRVEMMILFVVLLIAWKVL